MTTEAKELTDKDLETVTAGKNVGSGTQIIGGGGGRRGGGTNLGVAVGGGGRRGGY
jgi:hypothetical protein